MEDLAVITKRVRERVLDLIYTTRSPHIGPSFSIVEILISLYFKILNISPSEPSDPNRDRFILSKGHACAAFYAVLFEKGFISEEDLAGFAVNGGRLEQHPTMDLSKGIEVSTGSLGHGLSIGVGIALGAKFDKKGYQTYVLLSDGELNEGSIWEAAMFAGHHRLSNLTVLVDFNRIQALGFTRNVIDLEPLTDKWSSFGWAVQEADGHDFRDILRSFKKRSHEKPNCIIFHTVKGKGVSFMENELLWHYRAPDDEEYRKAVEELQS